MVSRFPVLRNVSRTRQVRSIGRVFVARVVSIMVNHRLLRHLLEDPSIFFSRHLGLERRIINGFLFQGTTSNNMKYVGASITRVVRGERREGLDRLNSTHSGSRALILILFFRSNGRKLMSNYTNVVLEDLPEVLR